MIGRSLQVENRGAQPLFQPFIGNHVFVVDAATGRPYDRAIMRSTTLYLAPLVLILLAAPRSASAVALYNVDLEATLEFGGGAVDGGLLQIVDLIGNVQVEQDGAFPSFGTADGTYGSDGNTIEITAFADGQAVFTGGASEPLAEASSIARTSASFGVLNPTEFGWFLDLTLTGFFSLEGRVEADDAFEFAYNIASLSLFGNILEGLTDEQLTLDDSTRRAGIDDVFQYSTSTQILGFRRNWSVLIPPSSRPGEIRIWSVGVFGQAGGQAVSGFPSSGTAIVIGDPDGQPEALPRPVPEAGSLWLLGAGLAGLAWLRRRSV